MRDQLRQVSILLNGHMADTVHLTCNAYGLWPTRQIEDRLWQLRVDDAGTIDATVNGLNWSDVAFFTPPRLRPT
jgi:hypothetical protein